MVVGALAYLPEEVNTCAILPLEPLHTDPVCRHPGSLYSAVGDMHQSYYSPNLNVSARLRVGFFHLVARRLANLFRVTVASTPRSPSTKATKEEKCRRRWRQASRYIRFPLVPPRVGTSLDPLSCASRHVLLSPCSAFSE